MTFLYGNVVLLEEKEKFSVTGNSHDELVMS